MNTKHFSKQMGGFTLIELLLVIGVLAILAVGVFAALNPAKRFRDARNARRSTDVGTILSAVHSFVVDSGGNLPTGMSAGMAEVQIGTDASGCTLATGGCSTADACYNLAGATGMTSYMASNPIDPTGGTTFDATETGYSVSVTNEGIITIKSCGAEGTTISSAR
jgi:prepilin-type N-terminal cleavage/methylation domain-containing protein